MMCTVSDRPRSSLTTGFGLAIPALLAAGCASSIATNGIRPAIGSTYSIQEAGLTAADQARLDGAVWLDAQTGRAVGLHFTGRDQSVAYARPLGNLLSDLGLRLLE